MSKRKLLLKHGSATTLISVSFIMCMHIFFFIFELSNYVTSFVVGANVVPFKYIGNKTSMIFTRYTTLIFFILFFVTYIEYLSFKNFLLCGDIKTNPGSFNRCKSISFYHWNLTGMLACNYKKFYLVEAFVISKNFDIFCISETFLDSSVDNIYDGLNINGYTLVRSYYPSNTKRGSVAIYFKDHLPVIRMNDISSMNESIILEIRLTNYKCFSTGLSRSLSRSEDQFDELCLNFNVLMSNINDEKLLAFIITGDFNARSKNW